MAAGPKITEEYQRKLQDFLATLPPIGQEIKSGTPVLNTPYTSATLDAKEKAKECVTDPNFKKFTGWEHIGLLRKWLVDRTTTCNEFVTKCANAMGLPPDKAVGKFDIKDQLSRGGLGHCWIPAESGATPEYGDIFRLLGSEPDHNGVRLNHIAVALYVDGSDFYTAEGGQGGRSLGYDKVQRRKRQWKPNGLQGWVSIKALLNSGQPLPFWLGGWWEVLEEPYDTYYYHFGANGKVSFSSHKPVSPVSPPMPNATTGTFSVKGYGSISISWNSADPDETLTLPYDKASRKSSLNGKTLRGVALSGSRIVMADKFG